MIAYKTQAYLTMKWSPIIPTAGLCEEKKYFGPLVLIQKSKVFVQMESITL